MDKLRLIIAREYMSIVGRKSFIVMTLLIPILMVIICAIPVLMAWLNDKGSETQQIAVIDYSGRYAAALHSDDMYNFVALRGDTLTDAREFYNNANGSFDAIVQIPSDVDSTGMVNISSEGTITPALVSYVRNAISDTIEAAHLAAMGIPNIQQMMEKAHVNVDVHTIKWSDSGDEEESSTNMGMVLGLILAMIIYMFVLMYGAMIMNSVIEEKTNRIVEVVVSSCRPFQLMLGKIIGVGLVGLTQMAIWGVLLTIIATVAGSIMGIGVLSSGTVTPESLTAAGTAATAEMGEMESLMREILSINYGYVLLNFVLYFIGGYLLYSSLFAAMGSAVDQPSDASQFTTPIILIMLIALYAGIGCMENPSGPMAVWCSIIPFTSPVAMMVRLPFGVPLWQLLLSLALLFGTALLITWIAARIYRRGILHYGQKASVKDLFKWMK